MAVKKPAPTPREDPQQYVLKRNYKKAIEIYRGMVKDATDDANVGLRLADCLVLDNQVPAAVQEYKRVAQLYAEQGFLLKAIGVNKKIVKLDPAQREVHQNLSRLYEERGLLAKPDAGPAPRLVDPVPASPGSHIDFGMEAAGEEMDIQLGSQRPAPALAEVGLAAPDDLAPDLPEPDVTDDQLPGDMSLDELGDALGDEMLPAVAAAPTRVQTPAPTPARAAEPTRTGLGFDFGMGAPAAPASPVAPPSPVAPASGLGGFDFGMGAPAAPASPVAPPSPVAPASGLGGFDFGMPEPAAAAAPFGADPAPFDDPGSGIDAVDSGSGVFAAPEPAKPAITRTPLFSDLTADEFVEVVNELTQETYPRDAVIVAEGDPGDSLFVVVNGSVRVMTQLKGKDLRLADLKEGDFFGEGALITGGPRTATIIANEDSDLLCLSKLALDRIVAAHPRVMEVMKQFYEQRAEDTVDVILGLGKK